MTANDTLTRMAMAATRPLAVVVGILAAMCLAGYALDLGILYRPLRSGPAAHPMTLCIVLLLAIGISLQGRHAPRRAASLAGGLALVLCLIRLAAPVAGQDLFQILTPFREAVTADRANGLPNGVGGKTAIMFLLQSLALLLHMGGSTKASQLLAFLSLSLPMLAITGYAYGLPDFYGEMSLTTVALAIPLGLAVAGLSAHRGLLRALLSPHVTGRIARVQIVLGYAVPFGFGFLLLHAMNDHGDDHGQAGLFGLFVVATSWFVILLVAVSAIVHERVDHIRRLHERALARTATIDPLTDTYNRRRFDQVLEAEVLRARRSGEPFSVIMVDLDHFKHINDTGGHAQGDEVLRKTAAVLKRTIRATDVLGRIGGEEFAVLLPATPLPGAAHVAEQMRQAVACLEIAPWDGHDGRITASFGCATAETDDTASDIMARADEALYAAKAGGRDQVRVVVPSHPGTQTARPFPIASSLLVPQGR